jgi:hypothetical protein
MNMAHCEEVIITTTPRGRGEAINPYRTVTQVFKKNGDLISENDPEPQYSAKEMLDFANWAMHSCKCSSVPDLGDLKKWKESQ